MDRITDTVKTLLIINVVFFVGSMALSPGTANGLFAMWFPSHPNFQIWQPLTYMFMHGGMTHIFFNMFNLYMFGSILENSLGKNKFLFLYFSSGFGAVLLHLAIEYYDFYPAYAILKSNGLSNIQIQEFITNTLKTGSYTVYEGLTTENLSNMINTYRSTMVGASGAVSGLFMGFAVLYPNLPLQIMFIPVPIKAKYLIGGYFLMDLYFAISGQSMFSGVSVAHWAHIGGAVIGFITIWYWKKNSFNDKRWY